MRFVIKTLHASHGVGCHELEAEDEHSAVTRLLATGHQVISVSTARRFQSSLVGHGVWRFSARLSTRFPVALFCQELLSLLDAGMGLVETIALLGNKAKTAGAKAVLLHLHRLLGEGRSFSQALEMLEHNFPVLLVSTVRAAERTGKLPEALRRYLDYQRQLNALREKVLAASIYPLLLLGVGMLVVMFLLGYVVPRFATVYEDIGHDRLPVLSQWLMQWGQWVGQHTVWMMVFSGIFFAGLVFTLTRPALRAAVGRALWRLPAVGEQLRIYQLARFTRTVSMLLQSGIPLVSALEMTGELLQQPTLKQGLLDAQRAIREGRSVSETFDRFGLSTEIGTRLLVVGERSGELGGMMQRIATFYDDQISRSVDWLSRLFEPVLMITIGFLIGGIVILMYLPIFELAGSLQ